MKYKKKYLKYKFKYLQAKKILKGGSFDDIEFLDRPDIQKIIQQEEQERIEQENKAIEIWMQQQQQDPFTPNLNQQFEKALSRMDKLIKKMQESLIKSEKSQIDSNYSSSDEESSNEQKETIEISQEQKEKTIKIEDEKLVNAQKVIEERERLEEQFNPLFDKFRDVMTLDELNKLKKQIETLPSQRLEDALEELTVGKLLGGKNNYYNKYKKYKSKYLNLIHGGMFGTRQQKKQKQHTYKGTQSGLPVIPKEYVKNILVDNLITKNRYKHKLWWTKKESLDLLNESTDHVYDSSIEDYINIDKPYAGIYTGKIKIETVKPPPFEYKQTLPTLSSNRRVQPARKAAAPEKTRMKKKFGSEIYKQREKYRRETGYRFITQYMTADNKDGYLIYKLPILVKKELHYLSNFQDRIDYFVYQGPYANDSFLPETPDRLTRSFGKLSGFKNIKQNEDYLNPITGQIVRNYKPKSITVRVFSFIGTFKEGLPVSGYGHFDLGLIKPESNIQIKPGWTIDGNNITTPDGFTTHIDDYYPEQYQLNLPPGWNRRDQLHVDALHPQGRIVYIPPPGQEPPEGLGTKLYKNPHTNQIFEAPGTNQVFYGIVYNNGDEEPNAIYTENEHRTFDTQVYYGPMNFSEGNMNSTNVDFEYERIKDLELPGSHEYSLVKEYDHYGFQNNLRQRQSPKSDIKYNTELSKYFEAEFKTDIEELKIEELNEVIKRLKELGNKEADIKIAETLKNRIETHIQPTFIFNKYKTLYTGNVENFKEDDNADQQLHYFSSVNEEDNRSLLMLNSLHGEVGYDSVLFGVPQMHPAARPRGRWRLPTEAEVAEANLNPQNPNPIELPQIPNNLFPAPPPPPPMPSPDSSLSNSPSASDSDDDEMEQPPQPPQPPQGEAVPLDPEVMLNPGGLDLADPNQQPPEPWLDLEEVD